MTALTGQAMSVGRGVVTGQSDSVTGPVQAHWESRQRRHRLRCNFKKGGGQRVKVLKILSKYDEIRFLFRFDPFSQFLYHHIGELSPT